MINKFSNLPLYCQLKDLIIDKIESGEYEYNERIPSEQELCESFNISRPTVRQAITELCNSGILNREKGKGTFVAPAKSKIDIRRYTGFTDSILDSEIPGDHRLLSITVEGRDELGRLAEAFGGRGDSEMRFAAIRYLTSHNDEILSLNTSYISLSSFPNIIEDVRSKKPSFEILSGKYAYLPAKTKSSLEVIYADQNDAGFLQMIPGQSIIRIENVVMSKTGQVVEVIISKYRGDKSKLLFENVK